uniref:fimbria/pilus outer membrane usher protein n=1 Tax=Castellaniella defragrans TaxID=75697 RepID=UPI00333F4BC7
MTSSTGAPAANPAVSPTAGQASNPAATPAQAAAEAYVFDASLFRGGRISVSMLERFNKADDVPPGTYKVDIYVNQQFFDRSDIEFVLAANDRVQPCLDAALLKRAGVAAVIAGDETAECHPIGDVVAGSSSRFDMSRLRLDLSIPQSLMNRVPRGYVNPDDLDAGATIGFVNYIGNAYHVSYQNDLAPSQRSAYLSLSGGVNLGAWQYRQQSTLTYSSQGQGTRWSNLRSYVQRPLPALDSQLTIGQTFTTGRFFSGLSYTGVNLATDERMLPDSMRGYAPIVRGVANTNARVSISQNGREIYQTTVAPGPFEITDLYPTSYSGDLEVEVIEANGTVNRFSVPFSAVPESMRPGTSRYNFSVGRTRDIGEDTLFGDLTYQRGLSNTFTVNSGLRLARGYQAAVLGGVYSSPLGAFGLDMTYSRADIPDSGTTSGWMAHVSYSRTFQPTQTSVTLAGYRYSTSGYRDLADVIGLRALAGTGVAWESPSYMQRNRVELSLNQNLGRYGTVFVSGAVQDYRDGRERDTQLQLGYGKAFSNGISVNLSVGRQQVGGYNWITGGYDGTLISGRTETVTMLSVSLPLGRQTSTRTPTLSTSYTHSDSSGSQYQATVSGMADEAQTLSYSLGASHAEEQGQTVWNGSVQKRFPSISVGVSASRGDSYWQAAGNAQGALAVHSGGVTFGPYLADTFALVEAKGAKGASVLNSQGTRIDGNGYALVPAVTPYRYSSILLDPQGMEGNTELEDGEQRVAPYAGAAVKVVFKTRTGSALLIHARMADGQAVPLGAEAYDESGGIVGMVGQGSQVYVRTEDAKGRLILKWGDHASEQCSLPYDTAGLDLAQPLIKLEALCASGPVE